MVSATTPTSARDQEHRPHTAADQHRDDGDHHHGPRPGFPARAPHLSVRLGSTDGGARSITQSGSSRVSGTGFPL